MVHTRICIFGGLYLPKALIAPRQCSLTFIAFRLLGKVSISLIEATSCRLYFSLTIFHVSFFISNKIL